MDFTIYIIIIAILIFEYLYSRTISLLNIKNSTQPLPPEIADVYNADKYARQQQYFRTNAKFGWTTSTFKFLVFTAIFAFGGYALIDNIARSIATDEWLVMLLFFGILLLLNLIIGLPFNIYDTFVIEQKYGFNRATPKIFATDTLKHLLLTAAIGGGLLLVIYFLYQWLGSWFWLAAWGAVSAFSLFMSLFYSDLIVPLFNKQTPLEEGELRTAIQNYADKVSFHLKDIYVMDSSKRSTKANAYFTGFGKKKRIVLYDTLIQQLSTDEIVAVLAHEIGHYKHHDTLKNLFLSLSANLLLFYLFGVILKYEAFAQAAGCAQASFHVNLLVFSLLYSPVNDLLGFFINIFSRRCEYRADQFAALTGNGDALITSLKKISGHALSNLTPHPIVVALEYSHPTLVQRIKAIRNLVK